MESLVRGPFPAVSYDPRDALPAFDLRQAGIRKLANNEASRRAIMSRAASLLAVFGLLVSSLSAIAADPVRGKTLYETRCVVCHNTNVHQSTSRKATSFSGVRAQVARWSGQLGTSWDPGDVDDISVYLNDLYYKLPCPPQSCTPKTSALSSPLPPYR